MITEIIFDWGSVMCPDNNRYAAKFLSERYGCNEKDLYAAFSTGEVRYFRQQQDRPFFDNLCRIFDIPSHELKKALNAVKPYKEMFSLTKQLSKRYRIHLFSNQAPFRTDHIKASYNLSHFDHLFFSSEMGLMKPEKEAFLFVLEKIRKPAEGCLFVDDNRKFTDTARELGINVLLFKNMKILKNDLRKKGVL